MHLRLNSSNIYASICLSLDAIFMQQSYSRSMGVIEAVSLTEIVGDSLKMNVSDRHEINIVTGYEELPVVQVDRHMMRV